MRITLAIAACVLLAGGCASRPAPGPGADAPAGIAEAHRLFEQARREQADGNLLKAEDLYRAATLASPDFGAAWNNLGTVLLEQGRHLDAADAFRIAAEKSPTDPRPYQNLGYVYYERGWTEEALKYYVSALSRAPSNRDSLRGAVASAKHLNLSNTDALERARRGMLIETDPAWREVFQREAMRIQADLAAKDPPPRADAPR